MTADFRIISIGTLSRNRLWNEGGRVRTPHATTTLVTCGDGRRVLVDPSLPPAALAARYYERTGGRLEDVTDVFCTTLRPVHRGGLEALGAANLWAAEAEIDAYRGYLDGLAGSAERLGSEAAGEIDAERKRMERFRPAPDRFDEQVHLFPLAGPSAGSAGLLLTPPTRTVLVAGDAALTAEHVLRGQVWEGCFDAEAAMNALGEVLEIADLVVPGHDNLFVAPRLGL